MRIVILLLATQLTGCAFLSDNVFSNKAARERSAAKKAEATRFKAWMQKRNPERTRLLKIGQTESQVREVFGKPDRLINSAKGMIYFYSLIEGETEIIPYLVLFSNGAVVNFLVDENTLRENNANRRHKEKMGIERQKVDAQNKAANAAFYNALFPTTQNVNVRVLP